MRLHPSQATDCIDAILLVGGFGTRLRPVLSDLPKALATIRGRPFLSYLLDELYAGGIRRAVLATGYLADRIESMFGDRYAGISLEYSREDEPLGTGGAVRLAWEKVPGPFALVLNGDSVCGVEYPAFLERHRGSGAKLSLATVWQPEAQRFGRVECDSAGRVVRFHEKGVSCAGWINAGVYAIDRETALSIPEARNVSLEREVFPLWLGRGLCAQECAGPFIDIGTPESLREADAFFAGRRQSPGAEKGITI